MMSKSRSSDLEGEEVGSGSGSGSWKVESRRTGSNGANGGILYHR